MSPRDWAFRRTDPCFHQNRWMLQSGWGYYFPMRGHCTHLTCHVGRYLSHCTILEIRNAIWEIKRPDFGNQTFKISIGKRLIIKNAFQRAYSTNLENISVHLVIEIVKFWNSNSSVIWEIRRHKFWKSKVSFQKSNVSNFRNQKCNWEIKRNKLWKWKVLFEKSNATNLKSKPKGFFLLIVEKISKSKKTRKESDILHFICDTPQTP